MIEYFFTFRFDGDIPFSQDYGLTSYNSHYMCVNLMRERRAVHFNADSERQIFEKVFHGRFIYSQRNCPRNTFFFDISF